MPAGTTGRSWGTAMGGGWLCWLALWQPQVTRASVSPLLHGERLSYHPPAWALGQAGPQGEPGGGGWWHLLAMGQGRVTPSPMAGVPPPQQTPVTHPLPLQYPTSPVAPQRFMVPGTVALGCVCVSPPRGPPPPAQLRVLGAPPPPQPSRVGSCPRPPTATGGGGTHTDPRGEGPQGPRTPPGTPGPPRGSSRPQPGQGAYIPRVGGARSREGCDWSSAQALARDWLEP